MVESRKKYLLSVVGIIAFIALAIGLQYLFKDLTSRPSVVLTSDECDPPCWYGITPDQSNSSQVYEILENLDEINLVEFSGEYDKNEELKSYYWFFERPTADSGGSVYFTNDQVTVIEILAVNSLTLKELFTKLGEPEQIWKEIGFGENRKYLDVFLLYPNAGSLAEVLLEIEYGDTQVTLKEKTPVYRVAYFAPPRFPELWETQILINIPVTARTGTFTPWQGYGSISLDSE